MAPALMSFGYATYAATVIEIQFSSGLDQLERIEITVVLFPVMNIYDLRKLLLKTPHFNNLNGKVLSVPIVKKLKQIIFRNIV